MKLKFDVTTKEYELVRQILADHLPKGTKVWVFGSRAKHTARFNSDLDLALDAGRGIDRLTLAELKDAFNDAPLSYAIDLVDMQQIDASFRNHIGNHAVGFPIATQANVPKLRFPGFEGEWAKASLGNFCQITTGRLDANSMVPGGEFPFFTCAREVYQIDEPAFNTEALLISGNGANVGYVHYYQGQFNAYQRTYVLDQFSENIHFVQQKLYRDLHKRIFSEVKEGNTPYIVKGTLSDMPVLLPDLSEQQKIAAFLGSVDAKIEQLSRKKVLLIEYKRGVMQQIFEQKIRFKDDQGKDFPDWEEKRLGDVFYERKDRDNRDGTLLSVTLNHGVVKASDLERTISASSDRSNYKSVNIKDIAYNSMRMWQGASGKSDFNGIVSPAYTVITPAHGQNSTFWAYYFKLQRVIGLFERYSQGLTSDTWNLKYPAFSKIPLISPKAGEQRKIANFLTAIDTKIDLVSQQLDAAQTFKRGLLQQMFV